MKIIKIPYQKFIFRELFLGIIIIIVSRGAREVMERTHFKIKNEKFKISIYIFLFCTILKKRAFGEERIHEETGKMVSGGLESLWN